VEQDSQFRFTKSELEPLVANAAGHAFDNGGALSDVVYRYGFADLSHFNRRFKRIYGMTPRQYQASIDS